MIHYVGNITVDIPNGAGSHVAEHHDGGEVLNFKAIANKCYGFARIQSGRSLRLQRLGAAIKDEFIDDVTVVFFATDPNIGGQYVVGWYDQARLYRKVQYGFKQRAPHPFYITVTDVSKAVLLPVPIRKFSIPSDGPGQTNAWYVQEYEGERKYLRSFDTFRKDPENFGKKKSKGRGGAGKGWMLDAKIRKDIEVAAMDAVYNYFRERDFEVSYVHNEKKGWDMEARKGKILLRLEVKGTHKPINTVNLTPNEYQNSTHADYRVCILEQALDKAKAQLHIARISFDKQYWITETGNRLKIEEVLSAKLRVIT